MGFTKLKIRCKVHTPGRGHVDAFVVIKALKEHWKELHAALEAMPEEERDAFKDHFNNCIEGEQGLGTVLFDSYDNFESRIKFLDEDLQEEYT